MVLTTGTNESWTWRSTDFSALKNAVDGWVNGGVENDGFGLLSNTDYDQGRVFDSREATTGGPQLTVDYSIDTNPPTPNPSTWATAPYATGTTSISMTATTASDPGQRRAILLPLLDGRRPRQRLAGGRDVPGHGLSPNSTYTYQVMNARTSRPPRTKGATRPRPRRRPSSRWTRRRQRPTPAPGPPRLMPRAPVDQHDRHDGQRSEQRRAILLPLPDNRGTTAVGRRARRTRTPAFRRTRPTRIR